MVKFSATLTLPQREQVLVLAGSIQAEATSISEVYVVFHLPAGLNSGKSLVEVGEQQPRTRVEQEYGSYPDGGHVELKATAGNSQYPLLATLSSPGGMSDTSGETGDTLSLHII